MKKIICLLLFATFPGHAAMQEHCKKIKDGMECIPPTSMRHPSQLRQAMTGQRKLYTNYSIYVPSHNLNDSHPIETPASIACLYNLTTRIPGCPINGTTAVPAGGSGIIGIIDTGDSTTLEADLNVFSQRYGLRECTTANECFKKIVITPSGNIPAPPDDYGGEQHIDVEWAHAMAPSANIILYEGDKDQTLENMVERASADLASRGGGIISISIAGPEFADELNSDAYYQTSGIVFITSAGDYGPPARYPSTSPYVISAGGAMIMRDSSGNFIAEQAWNHGGGIGAGGPSAYESRPVFQNSVQKIVGNKRGTPDIAFASYSLSIYNSTAGSACKISGDGWCAANGTSISAPGLAGILNSANRRFNSSQEALTYIYTQAAKNYRENWNDITAGNSGPNGYYAMKGYDFCTGLGTPRGYGGK